MLSNANENKDLLEPELHVLVTPSFSNGVVFLMMVIDGWWMVAEVVWKSTISYPYKQGQIVGVTGMDVSNSYAVNVLVNINLTPTSPLLAN